MGRNHSTTTRDIVTAIGLSAWVAGLLDLMVTVVPAVHADKPIAPVLAAGRGLVADPSGTGPLAIAMGLGAHFALMLVVAAIFVLATRKVALSAAHPVIFGVLYGAVLFFLLPDHGAPPTGAGGIALAVLRDILCIGLPIGLITWQVQRRTAPAQ